MHAAPRLAALLAVPAVALSLAACGASNKNSAGDFKGEQKAVAQAIEDLQKAGSKGDAAKICNDLLAPDLVAQIKQSSKDSCDAALKDALADADAFELQVKKVTLHGDAAEAVVQSEAGKNKKRTDTLGLQRVGGAWKIASLGSATGAPQQP